MNLDKKAYAGVPVLAALLLFTPAQASAMTQLKGREAADFIGDPKAHFVDKGYTFEILKRSHRDAMHGRFSDALLFNPGGGLFSYPRRKDGDHHVVFDAPDGREEEPVREDEWRKLIANSLSDDNPEPVVFLDDQGQELGVVYIGRGTQIKGSMNASGLLEVEIEVPGGKETRGRRRGPF